MKIIAANEGREWKVELPQSEYAAVGKKRLPVLAGAIASHLMESGRQMLIAVVGAWQNEVFFNKEFTRAKGLL